jgi:hypothetical protein
MLAQHKASKIVKEYDEEGNPSGLTFAIRNKQGELPIKLPCDVNAVLEVFEAQVDDKKLPRKYAEGEWARKQAARTGWRNLQDWIKAQLALLETGMVRMEQIFLPYMLNLKEGKTMFELFEERNFKMLPEGRE